MIYKRSDYMIRWVPSGLTLQMKKEKAATRIEVEQLSAKVD